MTVYYFVYALIISTSCCLFASKSNLTYKKKIACNVYFSVLVFLFALRHPSMGVDLAYGASYGYLGSFSVISDFSWLEALDLNVKNYERGYILFNKLLSLISDDQQMLLIGCAFGSILPIAYVV